ncbi:MAG: fructose-bisphosphate aldolase [Deltaproteobacteria bacterium]|nr:MAG: fructose-bisphosphate aldolase [Deltaproteobacteria bacterium]
MAARKAKRPTLHDLDLKGGKKARLYDLMYKHGPGGGTMLLLPIDQGLEHGPIDFFPNPPAQDPEFQLELALRGGYSGIVFHIGLAEKYMKKYWGKVPLVLKLNGKTSIPPDDEAFSPQTADVEDAVRLGASAVGYTLYVGSPAQDRDFLQFGKIRRDAERFGMPVIVWAYPRGRAVNEKGGKDSIYAIDYAARVADELGADVVKVNIPTVDPKRDRTLPGEYGSTRWTMKKAVEKVVKSAGKTLVIFSGGSKIDDAELLRRVKTCMEAGATGFIFGRNMWQREMREALSLTEKIKRIMSSYRV